MQKIEQYFKYNKILFILVFLYSVGTIVFAAVAIIIAAIDNFKSPSYTEETDCKKNTNIKCDKETCEKERLENNKTKCNSNSECGGGTGTECFDKKCYKIGYMCKPPMTSVSKAAIIMCSLMLFIWIVYGMYLKRKNV